MGCFALMRVINILACFDAIKLLKFSKGFVKSKINNMNNSNYKLLLYRFNLK
jgi:hypothetical protein